MIKIRYSLKLPEGVNTGGKDSSKTYQFNIIDTTTTTASTGNDGHDVKKSYYDALRDALEEARSQIGDDLAEWRDCIDKKELNEELKKGNGDEEEEEEEEEEES